VKRQVLAFLSLGGAMSVAACGNILGLKDLEPYPTEGGTEGEGGADSQEEASPDSPAMGDDTSTHDAHEATTTDAREEDGATEVGSDVVTMDSPQDTNPPMDSPTCTGGMVSCGGTCVNLTNNGSNCGRCSHDCQSGQCMNSMCQPVELLSGTVPFDIVVANGVLFWVDQLMTVWQCSAANCLGTDGAILTGLATPVRIAWDGNTTLFWTNNGSGGAGSVEQYTIGSGAHTTLTPAGVTITAPQGIAATSQYVFWTDTAAAVAVRFDRSTSTAVKYSLGAGAVPAGITLCSGGTRACWTDEFTAAGMAGNVTSLDVAGWSSVGLLAASQDQPWSITDDGTQQFWVNYDAAATGGAVVSSGGATVASQDKPVRIASDSSAVFWTNQGSGASNGSVMVAAPNLSASSVQTLVPNLASPVGLAIDASTVYYGVTGSNGMGIWKVARP